MDDALFTYLKDNNIKYEEYSHKAVFTVAESHNNEEITKIPGLRTKNLFLKSNNSDFYLICMPGEKRLDIKLLKKELDVKDLQFASPEELKNELNLTPGSVSIFGMIYSKNTSLIIDESVWSAKEAGFHPNINNATLVLTHANIERFVISLKKRYKIIKL